MSTHSIVLAHGIFRYDELSQLLRQRLQIDLGPHYFDGVADALRTHGFHVVETDVSFAGSLAKRANQLRDRLRSLISTGSTPIHIIGHSMGGLDARVVIAEHEDIAAHVTCLTTIGTPHHGTTAADLALRAGGRLAILSLLDVIDLEGFEDLTTESCRRLNQQLRDREAKNAVRYRTVAASEDLPRTISLLQSTWVQINLTEGANDGIVARSSQAWTPALVSSDGHTKRVDQLSFPIPADHLNEVGLWDPAELVFGGLTPSLLQERVREFYVHLAATA